MRLCECHFRLFKLLPLVSFLGPTVTAFAEEPGVAKVIYGVDNRRDLFEVTDRSLRGLARSAVALIHKNLLHENGDGTFTLLHGQFGASQDLCPSERFFDQPVASFCSGFLVGPDLIATAGHCMDDCESTRFVFGYEMFNAETPLLTLSFDDVYSCRGIVESRFDEATGADWAIVRLDRPADVSHTPLTQDSFRNEQTDGRIAIGDPVAAIGHPKRLPLKITDGATVRRNNADAFFEANLDLFGGNSGSMVINTSTNRVEGIAVRAIRPGYEAVGNCSVVRVFPDDYPVQASVTRAAEFYHHLVPPARSNHVWVQDTEPNASNCEGAALVTGSTVTTESRAFIKFDLTGFLRPPEACLRTATLRLYVPFPPRFPGNRTSGTLSILQVADEEADRWRACQTNWENRPGCFSGPSASRTVTGPGWYEFEVGAIVREWLEEERPNNGFCLRLDFGEALIESFDGRPQFHPQLIPGEYRFARRKSIQGVVRSVTGEDLDEAFIECLDLTTEEVGAPTFSRPDGSYLLEDILSEGCNEGLSRRFRCIASKPGYRCVNCPIEFVLNSDVREVDFVLQSLPPIPAIASNNMIMTPTGCPTDFTFDTTEDVTVGNVVVTTSDRSTPGVTVTPGLQVSLDAPLVHNVWVRLDVDVTGQTSGRSATLTVFLTYQALDINGDGRTDIQDATAFGREFNGDRDLSLLDINCDDVVTIRDATAFGDLFFEVNNSELPAKP